MQESSEHIQDAGTISRERTQGHDGERLTPWRWSEARSELRFQEITMSPRDHRDGDVGGSQVGSTVRRSPEIPGKPALQVTDILEGR